MAGSLADAESQLDAHAAVPASVSFPATTDPIENAPRRAALHPVYDEASLLLNFLRTHDAPCPQCKYNLRGLTELRCPECGRALKLTIGLAEPFVLPWALATLFVAMAGSVPIMFTAKLWIYGLSLLRALVRLKEIAILSGLAYGAIALPLTVLLVRLRGRFFKLEPQIQWFLAAVAFGIDAALVFSVYMTH